jgi:hypothetical protein
MKRNKKYPKPYTDEETEYIKYLIKKYGYRVGTKREKYRVYK